jgi:integrase
MAAHKMKDGRWCEWLDLGTNPVSGQRMRRRVEARTKREAVAKAVALRERHQRGEDISEKPRTMSELFDDWIAVVARQGKAENTVLAYRRAISGRLKPHFGAITVPKMRTREIQRVFNDYADQLAPSYIRQLKTVLVSALNFAIEQGDRTDNPAEKVRIPIVKRSPARSLTPEETTALRTACSGHRYGLAILLALMGLRRAEIPGLRWEDFNEAKGTLAIRRQLQRINKQWTPIAPKDDSFRILTLGPKMIAGLQLHRRAQEVERTAMGWEDNGYIFISVRNGGLCPPSTIHKSFCAIREAAGISAARLHDCRHTAATKLLSEGTDIATVAEVLGHASPLVTASVYAHALPHKVADASKRLEELYNDDAKMPEARHQNG